MIKYKIETRQHLEKDWFLGSSERTPINKSVCLFHFTPFSNGISVILAGSFLTIVPGGLHQY
jgi:hypothetical protein